MGEGRLERDETHIEVLAQRVEFALGVDGEVLSGPSPAKAQLQVKRGDRSSSG